MFRYIDANPCTALYIRHRDLSRSSLKHPHHPHPPSSFPSSRITHPLTMLLWTHVFCLLSATFVTSQTPEILAGYEPGTPPEPLTPGLSQSSPENPHVIRGLLRARQSGCPFGYESCSNVSGKSVLLVFLFIPSPSCFIIFPTRVSVVFCRFAIYGRI